MLFKLQQLGDNFFERPESFFTNPANSREQLVNGVYRWRNGYIPPINGIDWQGDRLGRFYVVLGNNPGNIYTDVTLYGGAPEPATWVLAVMGLLGVVVSCRDCQTPVSKSAKVCPSCGAKNPSATHTAGIYGWIGAIVFMCMMGFIVFRLIH